MRSRWKSTGLLTGSVDGEKNNKKHSVRGHNLHVNCVPIFVGASTCRRFILMYW